MHRLCLLLMLLSGCAAAPVPPPTPTVLCQVPAGLLATQPPPQRPQGNYQQREVAHYLVALHQWGKQGWARLIAVKQWTQQHCE
ncbi:Rz1-like lysis system protein LysC [Spongiibacter sp. UBA1325]|uniref:Rz1-like lysis system protein LysC n=1 Tax=Spongiibacter sp. UBA1325 TaxID=1947543 RepID=UPI00257C1DA0|nr:hypothetical protein [Spongiibacter sp. UBA1325]